MDLSTWSLSVGIPLYRRSVHLGLQQGYREASAAEAQLKVQMGDLDWKLREAVGRFLLEAFKVEALETSLQIANRSQRETELRFEMGGRTRIDLLRAQANVVSLDSKRLSFIQAREAGRNSVLEVSGLSEAEFRDVGLEQGLKGEGALALAVAYCQRRRLGHRRLWVRGWPKANIGSFRTPFSKVFNFDSYISDDSNQSRNRR